MQKLCRAVWYTLAGGDSRRSGLPSVTGHTMFQTVTATSHSHHRLQTPLGGARILPASLITGRESRAQPVTRMARNQHRPGLNLSSTPTAPTAPRESVVTVECCDSSFVQNKMAPKNAVYWDVTPSGSCKNLRFGGTIAYITRVTRIGEP
jgi:hypothetical protein